MTSAVMNPAALGAGYFVFFLYAALLGTAAVALVLGAARAARRARVPVASSGIA